MSLLFRTDKFRGRTSTQFRLFDLLDVMWFSVGLVVSMSVRMR